ncbi:MAG: aldo/keto reductase [Thermoleophilaceae bacterium]|nr:aldo/keto reductase [Thermoleophilaceae bacterium]
MPSKTDVPQLSMNTGAEIAQLGFGVFQVPPEDTAETVGLAFDAGYRSIDTAAAYGNEEGVGKAVAEAGLAREEVFVTTKVWNRDHGRQSALRAFDASLGRLGLEYVDLYLIHWPVPSQDLYVETWQALEELHAGGRARAVGVCNFEVAHLERLLGETEVVPAVNQIELHPRLPQPELREFHAEHGILTEAWSPLAQGELLDDTVVAKIAEAHERTPAQVILRWHVEVGNIAIPKSVNRERIRQNIELFDFELSAGETDQLAQLGSDGGRVGPHPDSFGS